MKIKKYWLVLAIIDSILLVISLIKLAYYNGDFAGLLALLWCFFLVYTIQAYIHAFEGGKNAGNKKNNS